MKPKTLAPEKMEEIGCLLHKIDGLGEFLGFSPNADWETYRRAYDLHGNFDLVRLVNDIDKYQLWKNTRHQRAAILKKQAIRLLDKLERADETQHQMVRRYLSEVFAQWDYRKYKTAIARNG